VAIEAHATHDHPPASDPSEQQLTTRADWFGGAWREAFAVGLLVALWSLLFRGFDGGRWSDIPIFKSFIDPTLYVNDPFIYSLHNGTPAAYTYRFIAAVAGALSFLPLDAALFVLYLPTSVVSLALLYRLALYLVDDRLGAGLLLLFYVAGFRLLTVGSAILHSAELTPAFLALPFQIGALYAFLRKSHALAGALAGLGVVVHAPTSSYVGLAIGLAYLLRIRHYGPRNVAVAGGLMLLCAAPAVVGALRDHTDSLPGWALQLARIELATDISLAIAWDRAALRLYNGFGLVLLGLALMGTMQRSQHAQGRANAVIPQRSEGSHADQSPAPWREIPRRTLLGMTGTLIDFGHAALADGKVENERRRAVLALFGAVVILCGFAFAFIDVALRGPISTLVARLQFPRSAWIVNLIGLVYLAHYLRLAWATERLPRLPLVALGGAMLVSPSGFVPIEPVWLAATTLIVAGEVAGRVTHGERRRLAFRALDGLTITAVVGLAATSLRVQRTTLFDFNDAVRAAAVIGVLLSAWLLVLVLRGRADRTVALGAGLALALAGAFAVRGSDDWLYQTRHRGGLASAAEFQEWARSSTPKDSVFLILPSEPNNDTFYKHAERAVYLVRERANQAVYFREHNLEFQDRVLALGVSGVLRYREELDPQYRRLTEARVRELAARFGVTHFVPARAGEFTFPIVYQQGGWTVYEVTP